MLTWLLLSCATPDDLGPRGDCNPVDDGHCLLPFPSSFFLTDGQVSFGLESLPVNRDDVPIDPTAWNRFDGFPVLGGAYAHLPDASLNGTASHQDIATSMSWDSPTLLIHAESGELHPHFVERETQSEEGRQALILRPARPMRHGSRYLVVIRDLGGSAPPGFAALRDGAEEMEPDLARQQDHYEDVVFSRLDELGVDRSSLLLAWDFITVTEESSLHDIRSVRDQGLATGAPAYVIDAVSEGDCEAGATVGRHIEGHMTVPLFLDSWEPGSFLMRDEHDEPVQNGVAEVPFSLYVPCTLLEEPRAGAVVQSGHGVLGHRDDIPGSLFRMADDQGWLILAVSWTGMKQEDISSITLAMANDLTGFAMVPERLHQGHLEFMLAARMLQQGMLDEPLLTVDGVSLVDPDALYFYGVSQGGILGGGHIAMSPDIDRGVLLVPGTPFSLILTRSDNFQPFLRLLEAKYSDWMDISLLVPVMQMLWDPAESAGWSNSQDKDVLLQSAIGDAAVTPLAAQVMARSYSASLIDPPVRPVWGLDSLTGPFEGSALVEFDYGVEDPFDAVPASTDTNTHGRPPGSGEGQEQVVRFLVEGVHFNPCEGACDPG